MLGSYYVEVPVASVSVPGTMYCAARPIDQPFLLSRSQYMKEDHSAYVFPGQKDVKVVVSGLKPETEYRVRCIFDPDYDAAIDVTLVVWLTVNSRSRLLLSVLLHGSLCSLSDL